MDFNDLLVHVGHDVVVVTYTDELTTGEVRSVSIECETCNEVLVSEDA